MSHPQPFKINNRSPFVHLIQAIPAYPVPSYKPAALPESRLSLDTIYRTSLNPLAEGEPIYECLFGSCTYDRVDAGRSLLGKTL